MPTPQAIADCIQVLESLVAEPALLASVDRDTRTRLVMAAGRVSRPSRAEQTQLSRARAKLVKREQRAADEALLVRSGIRQKRLAPVFVTPEPRALAVSAGGAFERAGAASAPTNTPASSDGPRLSTPRHCYVCKVACDQVHPFYDQMCGPCGDFNYQKRSQTADLRGRVALISGARVKIGYQAAILLLRSGCRVIVTTRFPRDAALRYAREADYADWKERLQIYGLDLRVTPSIEAFSEHLARHLDRLDFVLHNACQTVRRPTGFYQHLMQAELCAPGDLPAAARPLLDGYETLRGSTQRTDPQLGALARGGSLAGLFAAPELSQLALTNDDAVRDPALFPAGQLDADLQQVDRRELNSWRLSLDQVGTVELLEVQLVNAIAPFVLNGRLRSLMTRERTFEKHIVNVSAMEGQFYRAFKTDKHPHTNMAKAALNMMTRTSAPDYVKDGIFMNSVDTGWVTDEDVEHIAQRKRSESGFHPPLDIVDGAARIVDPIFDGVNTGRHVWGQFLKDYRPTAW
ncbi:MAG TPA: SDR family NAD(P)-dependent oxidoreductase [Polyangiaceae bacterium]|nr:SDR family NAD(P)-dependent oxidoreductase [Polyangiaceae bacterium]